MPSPNFDVLCLGNAIVDVICQVEDDILGREQIVKGSMTLIDESRAEHLYRLMPQVTVVSGGSAANTAVGVASFGARAAFVGKVKNDEVGFFFTRDLKAAGVHFETPHAVDGLATARSFIMVTPDGQRSMNTFLGACQGLASDDIDPEVVRAASITYFEGYLWDPAAAKTAFRKAADIAHAAGRTVAITLSDSFCVGRYRAEFLDLIRSKTVDLVFANEDELLALYETENFGTAAAAIQTDCELAVITLGSRGAVVFTKNSQTTVPAASITKLVDTTGAGDLFASGFMAGLVRRVDHTHCAKLGALAAAEVIQHVGAHPRVSLSRLMIESGL